MIQRRSVRALPLMTYRASLIVAAALLGGTVGCFAATAEGENPDGSALPLPDARIGGPIDAPFGTPDAPFGAPDAAVGAPDAPVSMGNKRYLDRCTSGGECTSGTCLPDVGPTMFCSRTCNVDTDCADEHFCINNECVPDDTGTPCSTATPSTCGKGLCLGSGDGTAFCTKECGNASECPAGYACTRAGGSANKICVDIEKPCSSANSCGTGLCLSVQGCTAFCDSAADCPTRLSFLPQYTCGIDFGATQPICIPPSDILGPDPIGAVCPAAGANSCRSGACDADATPVPMCTQACNAESGCGPGLGCFPLIDTGSLYLVCNRAGTGDLGSSCSQASNCHSGLCDATGLYCTRLCQDGLCPSDMTCQPVPGFGIAICRR